MLICRNAEGVHVQIKIVNPGLRHKQELWGGKTF